MIQQNSPIPQQTKSRRRTPKNYLLPSSTPKNLKQIINSHLRSHNKLILSIEPLPNPSGAPVSSSLTPSGQPLKIKICKKTTSLETKQDPALSPPKTNNEGFGKYQEIQKPVLKENVRPEITQNYPQRDDLKTCSIPVLSLEAPIISSNNPSSRTQKKSSKTERNKSPSFIPFISGFHRKDPNLLIPPLKEEVSLSATKIRSGFNKRLALKNPQNTSHIGAVLQCLYHFPKAKSLFSFDETSPRDPDANKLKLLLKDFFHLMNTSSAEFVNQAAWKITQYLLNDPIHQVSCDSVQVFRTLIEELIPLSNDNGDFEPLKRLENLHILEISSEESIMDCLLDKPSMEISSSNKISFKPRSLRDLKDFPQIIAVALKSNSKREAIMQKFTVLSSRKGKRSYEFHAGVFEIREKSSNRSLAVIQCNGKGGSYYQFEDNSVKKVQLNEKLYIPRLIFYRSEP